MQYHIVIGSDFEQKLNQYFTAQHLQEDNKVLAVIDNYSFGPLKSLDYSFSDLRNNYWKDVDSSMYSKLNHTFNELDLIINIVKNIVVTNDEIVFWKDASINSQLVYFMRLHYLKSVIKVFNVINIDGLPFIDEDFKIFYPKHLNQIPFREIRKALILKRHLSLSSFELDVAQWQYFQSNSDKLYRIFSSNKSILLFTEMSFLSYLFDLIPNGKHRINKVIQDIIRNDTCVFHTAILHKSFTYMCENHILRLENGYLIK